MDGACGARAHVSPPRIPTISRFVPILVGVFVAVALSALVAVLLYFVDAKAQLEASARAQTVLGEVREKIDRRLETALAVPETLAAVIAAEERIDDRTFNAISARLIRANPSIRNVALAPGNVITKVHPVQGNEAALGLRYAEVPAQNQSVLRAMRSRSTVVVGPMPLVQGGTGLVSRTPVFLRDAEGTDTRYWGIVALAVDVGELLADIERIAEQTGFEIGIRAVGSGDAQGEVFTGDPGVFGASEVAMDYPLPGGGRWQMGAMPRAGWGAVRGVPLGVGIVLYALSVLLGWMAYQVLASRDRHLALSRSDALTGLANRKAFDYRLRNLLQAKPRSCALVLIDLDTFKPINDTHGHRAGDLVLSEAADRLRQLTRGSDVVYRMGGDEFAILVEDVRADRDMVRMAERAIRRISEPVTLEDGTLVQVGASAGVAVFPLGGVPERAPDVFDRADRALYRSKAQGGLRVQSEPQPDTRNASA